MSHYQVIADATVYGIYEAADSQAARDACAVDAGYESEADMEEQLGQRSQLRATEVTPVSSASYRNELPALLRDAVDAGGATEEDGQDILSALDSLGLVQHERGRIVAYLPFRAQLTDFVRDGVSR